VRGGDRRVELGAKCQQQRLVGRERHAVRFPSVSLDCTDERVLLLGTSLESAIALKHPLHVFLPARLGIGV
jgi:hypothetical protein